MLCDNDVISSKDLPMEVTGETGGHHIQSSDHWQGCTLGTIIKRTEMKVIADVLKQVKGNKLKAAQLLNISRSTLYTKIEEYNIT